MSEELKEKIIKFLSPPIPESKKIGLEDRIVIRKNDQKITLKFKELYNIVKRNIEQFPTLEHTIGIEDVKKIIKTPTLILILGVSVISLLYGMALPYINNIYQLIRATPFIMIWIILIVRTFFFMINRNMEKFGKLRVRKWKPIVQSVD